MANTIVEQSINKKEIEKVAKKLQKKYSRRSNINVELLEKKKTPLSKTLSIITNIIATITTLFCFLLCINTIVNAINHTPSRMFGYSTMQIASGSMSAKTISINATEYSSGFDIGDKIIVKTVEPTSLKVGDKIVFYAYSNNYLKYHSLSKEEIKVDEQTPTVYKNTLSSALGFYSPESYDAGANGAMLTFHHITNIYKDENGSLWFKTMGSANNSKDPWFINESMVIGLYDDSIEASNVLNFLNFLSSDLGFGLFLLLPILIIVSILVRTTITELHLSLLELDVVEEKRKITDAVCVKNNIGYRMDTKTKYKVLAQANEDEKAKYIGLLWKDGSCSFSMDKYYKNKEENLNQIKELLNLNEICEDRFNHDEPIEDIAIYYIKEKQKILKKISKK